MEKREILSKVGTDEKPEAREKRKAELFEKERQERLMKLDEWKVGEMLHYSENLTIRRGVQFSNWCYYSILHKPTS